MNGNQLDLNRFDTIIPPRVIKFWLSNAPVVFLVIAVITFMVGLNIFCYESGQVSYKLVGIIPFLLTTISSFTSFPS